MTSIQTGVDKLVGLISQKKKISIDDASKALHVGKDVVQEWAEFLEDEGIITIEYHFSKMMLCEKKVSKDAVIENAKEISSEKDALLRRIDVVLGSLGEQESGMAKIKKHFSEVQASIKTEMDVVKSQMKELESYDALKTRISKDISAQKSEYSRFMQDAEKLLESQQHKYSSLLASIEAEKKGIDAHKKRIEELSKARLDVETALSNARQTLSSIEKRLKDAQSALKDADSRMNSLKDSAERLLKDTEHKRDRHMPAEIVRLQNASKDIVKKQEELVKNVDSKIEAMNNYSAMQKRITESFDGVLVRSIEMEKMMAKIETDKQAMQQELEKLKGKVLAFSILSKDKLMKTQVKEIETAIAAIDKKKQGMKLSIEHLLDMIKGK